MPVHRPTPSAKVTLTSAITTVSPHRTFSVWQWLGRLINHYRDINLILFDQAIVSATNFATGILLARFLGLEEFGRFTLVWIVILLANMIQQSLITIPMMTLGAKQSNNIPEYYGAVLAQQGILCLICSGTLVIFGVILDQFFTQWHIFPLLLPLIAVSTAFQMQEFVRRYFFTRQRITTALMNDICSYGGQLILLIGYFLVFDSLHTEIALWIIAITSMIAAVIGFLQFEPIRLQRDVFVETTRKHWDFSKWIAAGSGMQWLGGQFFVVISAALFSPIAAGAIAAARNILGLTLILFAATDNIVPIKASAAYAKGGWRVLKQYSLKVFLVGGLANGLICMIAAFFAVPLMEYTFGTEYAQYSYLVYWFASTHFLMFFIRPLSAMLRAVEFTRPIANSSVLPMVFSLVASVPLISMMGLTGAMVVMLGTQVLLLLYLLGAMVHWKKENIQ